MRIKLNFGAALLLFSLILSSKLNFALIYIFCAAVHELGHLIAAKLLGIKIEELSLDIAGARITPTGQIGSYKKEFLLCAAGPVASVLLCLISVVIYIAKCPEPNLFDLSSALDSAPENTNQILLIVAGFSALQALINLLPISSFDGAKMLGAAVIYFLGERIGEACRRCITFCFTLVLWMSSVYLLIKVGQGLSLFSFSLCMFLKIFDNT